MPISACQQNQNCIVMKFGGTSVADLKAINTAADKVAAEYALGHKIIVVVSAMAGVTNQLVDYSFQAAHIACEGGKPQESFDSDAHWQEYDAIVSNGENITAGLMAITLQKRGITARSLRGDQVPILSNTMHGNARIESINPDRLHSAMNEGTVCVIAGFQGITKEGRITTLGRGGSDTTAVALAAAVGADRCDIYTDVDGVYTADPRIVPRARKLSRISYEEMLEMASSGAKVLQSRSVEMAMKHNVPLQVLSTFGDAIGSHLPGTILTYEEDIMEQEMVNGVTCTRDDAKITLVNVPDMPGVAARVFGPLTQAKVNVDMIVQNVSIDGKFTHMTFTVPKIDVEKSVEKLIEANIIPKDSILIDRNIAKVTVVGIGMKSHAGVAQKMFHVLADRGINIQVISTSEIKISVLVPEEYAELAVRSLHAAYGLDEIAG
jgi:aspartate kinase